MNEMNKDHQSSKLKVNNKTEIQEARESGSLRLCDETDKSQKKKKKIAGKQTSSGSFERY